MREKLLEELNMYLTAMSDPELQVHVLDVRRIYFANKLAQHQDMLRAALSDEHLVDSGIRRAISDLIIER